MFSFVFQIFDGNSGREDVVKHSLVSFTRARFVKFQPTEFNNHKALRVEIYGVHVTAGRVNRIAIPYTLLNTYMTYKGCCTSVMQLGLHLTIAFSHFSMPFLRYSVN